jgi:hypothetical protein
METYRPSGRFSARLVPTLLLASVTLATATYGTVALFDAVTGWKIAPLVLGGNALATFFAASLAVSTGRCRNAAVGAAAGVLTALVGVASSHAWSYARAVDFADRVEGASRPPGFAGYFAWRVENGYHVADRHTRFGTRTSGRIAGWSVAVGWLVEALVLVAVGRAAGRGAVGDAYCEACDAPTRRRFAHVPTTPEHVARLRAARDAADLSTLARSTAPGAPTTIYHLDQCPRCQRGWLSVTVRAGADGPREALHRAVELPADRAASLAEAFRGG